MSSLSVPKFKIENKVNYTVPETETESNSLNKESWRYLYDRTNDISNVPQDPQFENSNSTTEQDHTKQLPWLTLYKTHKDLLQVRLVTTIGYVEDQSSNYIPTFIKGFPLMLQGPNTQFNDKNNIPEKAWENNWPEYKKNVEDFSGNLNSSLSNSWLAEGGQVITDMSGNKNLIILDLNHNDFVLKNKNKDQIKFKSNLLPSNSQGVDGIRDNFNGKHRPDYLVIRIDSAVEETTFAYYMNATTLLAPGVVRNNVSGFNSSTSNGKFLKVFNYVYK